MSQRIFGAVLVLACLGLISVAWSYHAPYSYEPVGPKAYPILLLTLIALGALHLLLKSTVANRPEPPMDKKAIFKVATCIALFTLYATAFELLGFIPSSIVFAIVMARLYAGSWAISVVSGPALAITLYFLFDRVLDVPLPLGMLSSLEF
ncbi:tripartite tricarboxylate transporter TctB family protein [Pseudomonas sp. C11]|uniref:tripartite tricarboxylate transporter TctB family protein n=1 Tax=Pseudomonas sp. C11 TaxID=3075550 RepID=UPI002B00348E|nr:tripartite tricarboxylate transporter TctB family protein [Pseudomonas sp. C11]